MVLTEGRGGHDNLWSSATGCDSGFSSVYSASYPYYCGIFALDVTDPLNPVYKWRISATSAQAPYLGEPWSKIMIGKVRDRDALGNVIEKWVGFVGGGYNAADCHGGGSCDTRGKGFYVFDMKTGAVLWSYTYANSSSMQYSMPASPAIVDTDNDGFIDTVYIGDLGGNMWRFKMCLSSDQNCDHTSWTGGMLLDSSTGAIRPIYTSVAVARDSSWNTWVYWGTGDKTDPTAANAQEKLYAVKDNDRTTTYHLNDLDNITTGTYSSTSSKDGWYINFSGQGEKVLADPTVFGGVVYLTTYTPPTGNDPCSQAGEGSLYAVNYLTGAGIFGTSGGTRSMDLGAGIPSAPIVSLKPGSAAGADLYVTASGGAGTDSRTQRANFNPPGVANRTNVLFWRDKRVQ
jgi:type IV pilus assembly protein PilY1